MKLGTNSTFASIISMAFAMKTIVSKATLDSSKHKQPKKDMPLCSHCDVLGHAVGKCFKIHGYSVGNKSRSK